MKKLSFITPVLFAIYYVLFLYSVNLSETALTELPLPLAMLVVLALLIWAVLKLILRDGNKAAILATLLMFVFVSTGHIAIALQGFQPFGLPFHRHRYWLPVLAVLLCVISWLIVRSRSRLAGVTRFINTTIGVLMALSLFGVARYHIQLLSQNGRLETPDNVPATTGSKLGYQPDIYYIILDGYASQHTLTRIYDFDNSAFLDTLRGYGFYIADSSFANYAFTPSSLASSLNMEYVNYIADNASDDAVRYSASYRLVRNAKVVRYLKSLGYRYILLRSGFTATNSSPLTDVTVRCGNYNEFIKVLIHTTVLQFVEKHLIFLEWQRDNIRGGLEYLQTKAPALPGPKFVFAHILIPHSPFIFDAEGRPLEPDNILLGQNIWQPRQGYIEQMKYLNGQVVGIVASILKNSLQSPIIIIQGDHGPASLDYLGDPGDEFLSERMMILNAYHLPGEMDSLLYDWISPVNSFRLVFRDGFGMDIPPLEDRVYFSHVLSRFKFVDVTDRTRRILRESASRKVPVADSSQAVTTIP